MTRLAVFLAIGLALALAVAVNVTAVAIQAPASSFLKCLNNVDLLIGLPLVFRALPITIV
jgi:hypothetical protein